ERAGRSRPIGGSYRCGCRTLDFERRCTGAVRVDHANDPLIGTWILDQFQIVAVMRWGGTGRVYLANQVPMDRRVAIKVLGIGDAEMRLRFRNEARTISRLVHP